MNSSPARRQRLGLPPHTTQVFRHQVLFFRSRIFSASMIIWRISHGNALQNLRHHGHISFCYRRLFRVGSFFSIFCTTFFHLPTASMLRFLKNCMRSNSICSARKGLTSCWSQLLAGAMRRFNFMKQFSEFPTLALVYRPRRASSGSAPSR